MIISITKLSYTHLEQVWHIEQEVQQSPWSQKMIYEINGYGALNHVILKNEQVIGYFYAQKIADEINLLNISLASSQQNLGYGAKLLEKLIMLAQNESITSIWLEARASNKNAIHLYRKFGFNEAHRRYDYYPTKDNKYEDAIVMCCYL